MNDRSKKTDGAQGSQRSERSGNGQKRHPQKKRRFNNKKRPAQAKSDGDTQAHSRSQNKNKKVADGRPQSGKNNQNRKSSGNRNRRYNNRKESPKQAFMRKYDNLLNTHAQARQEYFTYFHRAQESRRLKLERLFFAAVERLREFEERMKPWQKELVENEKFKKYHEDHTYSFNRELSPDERPIVSEGPFDDPHELETQRAAKVEYAGDDEESVGTIEDYKKLKGL